MWRRDTLAIQAAAGPVYGKQFIHNPCALSTSTLRICHDCFIWLIMVVTDLHAQPYGEGRDT